MSKYLIDVNLPSRFSVWASNEYEHVVHINDELKDSEIWEYAKENSLTIVTKDTDFSDMIMLNNPPPITQISCYQSVPCYAGVRQIKEQRGY